MPPGRYSDVVLSNQIPCRVEHYSNDAWVLAVAGKYRYPLIPETMPVPRRRCIWNKQEKRYVLPFGCHAPIRWYVLDKTGQRVRQLLAHDNGTLGSRHELKIYYKSLCMKPADRTKSRITKLFARYPEKRDAVMDVRNTEFDLMRYRPWNLLKRKWMRTVLAARYNLRGKELETQTTIKLLEYHERPVPHRPPKGKRPPHFDYTLGPRNRAAQRDKKRREELYIEPPAPLHSGSWQ